MTGDDHEICGSCHVSSPRRSTNTTYYHTLLTVLISNTFWKFLRLGNSAWNFFVSVHGFLWFCWEPQGYFLGFVFCPYSITPVTWNLEYPMNIFFDGYLLLGLLKEFWTQNVLFSVNYNYNSSNMHRDWLKTKSILPNFKTKVSFLLITASTVVVCL